MNVKSFKKPLILLLLGVILVQFSNGQRRGKLSTMEYGKKVIDELCSVNMQGRGYAGNGDGRAAKYIKKQFEEFRLEKFRFKNNVQYTQPFYFSVNTFPGKMELKFDGIPVEPGEDFLVKPHSGGTETRRYFNPVMLKKEHVKSQSAYEKLEDKNWDNKCLVIDEDKFSEFEDNEQYKEIKENDVGAEAIIYLHSDDLVWAKSTEELDYPVLEVKKSAVKTDSPQIVTVNVEQEYENNTKSQNVLGYIEGRKKPDSFIVFTAHYDHLGKMGKGNLFHGANDNASGVSLMLNLARHFSSPRETPDFSIIFIGFTGEEAGLIGSNHFVNNPMFPLEKVKFLINLDMMGTGKDGMMTVNGKVYDEQFDKLRTLNEKGDYFSKFRKRGEAKNSDHYFFHKEGVPSFFCYLKEDYPYYHDINDIPENLSYEGYKPAFNLFVDFVESFNEKRRRR